MGETDEVDAYFFDELHLLIDEIVGHGGCVSGVVFVAVGSAEKKALAVEFERAMLDPLGMAKAEFFVCGVFAARVFDGDAALVELRLGGTPQVWTWDGEGCQGHGVFPRLNCVT